jgi:hypothetical protein
MQNLMHSPMLLIADLINFAESNKERTLSDPNMMPKSGFLSIINYIFHPSKTVELCTLQACPEL